MSASPLFDGLAEVRGTLGADLRGQLTAPITGDAGLTREHAGAMAIAIAELAVVGESAGLGQLELIVAGAPTRQLLAAPRAGAFLLVAVDPAKTTSRVEKTLRDWPRAAASAAPPPLPAPTAQREPWAALRLAVVRGQLAEAATCQRELGEAPAGGAAGAEPFEPGERERALATLFDAVASAQAGDAVGCARKLQELARPAQANLSLRWLAHHWIGRAALQGGSLDTARTHAKEALSLARQLDEAAKAASQWFAGELLARSADASQGLRWLAEARATFARLGESWGVARTWLAEARIHASTKDEASSAAAARRALEADPAFEEPALFLARRALARGNLAAAELELPPQGSVAAGLARALVDAVRAGQVTQAEVTELVHQEELPPSPATLHALERLANAAPAFAPARWALGWALLRRGKYAEASVVLRVLLGQELAPAVRAAVEAGLACATRAMPAAERVPVLTRTARAAPAPAATPTPTPRPGAVFSGQLSVFALPDLLEFLRAGKRTGLLTFSAAAGMGSLRFSGGRITAASSPAAPGLGQLLVQERKVTPLTLRAAASAEDDSDEALGARLVRDGAVPVGAVEDALRRGIELATRELVGWKEGEFAFEEAARAPLARPAVELDPQGLLLNIFKELDESSRPIAARHP